MFEQEWLNIFADNLAYIMQEYKLSQSDIAEETGVSISTVNKYLNKKQVPGIKFVINLSYALGLDINGLIDFDERIE